MTLLASISIPIRFKNLFFKSSHGVCILDMLPTHKQKLKSSFLSRFISDEMAWPTIRETQKTDRLYRFFSSWRRWDYCKSSRGSIVNITRATDDCSMPMHNSQNHMDPNRKLINWDVYNHFQSYGFLLRVCSSQPSGGLNQLFLNHETTLTRRLWLEFSSIK